jgi:phosphoribosyl 1,2-cyclic phosphodiesterase
VRARIWGSRGSLAAPGPETVRYGGNTSCVEVELGDGTIIVLDAGTGIRALGDALTAGRPGQPINVLLTHLHMDHLQGLAFFAPLWSADTELHVYGPRHPTRTLADRIANYLSEPLFPIHLSDVPSRPTFHELHDEEFTLGTARVAAMPVSHAGPTVGYRIEDGGRSLAYISDHEPARGVDFKSLGPEWISGFPLCENVDVLIHDSQYSAEEYESHVGWGHSSIEHVVHLANTAKVRQLVLYHHDPGHSDDTLEALLVRAKELSEADNPPVLAYEGMEIDLS